jgi:hypothetical protein
LILDRDPDTLANARTTYTHRYLGGGELPV